MKLTDYLGGIAPDYVMYYPAIARRLKSVTATILLLRLVYWQTRPVRDGEKLRKQTRADMDKKEVYKTEAELAAEIGFGRSELRSARAVLRKCMLLHERYARLEHQLYFRVDLAALDQFGASLCFSTKDENRLSGKTENEDGDSRKSTLATAENRPSYTQTTAHITAQTTTTPPGGGGQKNEKTAGQMVSIELPADLPLDDDQRTQVARVIGRIPDPDLRARAAKEYTARIRKNKPVIDDPVAYSAGIVARAQRGELTDGAIKREERRRAHQAKSDAVHAEGVRAGKQQLAELSARQGGMVATGELAAAQLAAGMAGVKRTNKKEKTG